MRDLIFIFILIIGKFFSFPFCQVGLNFCKYCNPITKLCEKCENNVLIPDNNGGCIGQKKCILEYGHCLECQEDAYICKICEEGYFPDENGGCSYSNNCEISYQGNCIKCKEYFILVGVEIKICKSLYSEDLKNCEVINKVSGLCRECKENYFLNNGDKKCIDLEYCQQSSFGTCEKCISNYYLDKKAYKCKKQEGIFMNCLESFDGQKCDICQDNNFFDGEGKCINFNYCLKQIDYNKCQKCVEGYYLTEYGDSCTKEKKCVSGDKNLGICKKCQNNYYIDLNDGKCKSNREENDFKYCEVADGECKYCIYNTYLGEEKCTLSQNCLESSEGICIQCIDNYHLDIENKCTGVDKCMKTSYFYPYVENCTECEDNYYYNSTDNTCNLEIEEYKNCQITNYAYCEKCRSNFYLNKTDNLCYNNKEEGRFYKCSLTDSNGNYCTECIKGYYIGYIDHKCSTIKGCALSENENKCLKCDSDFHFCLDKKTEKCEDSDAILNEEKKFYYNCNETNREGTACEICLDDFVLNEKGLCVDILNCAENDEDGKCKKCLNNNDEYYNYCLNSEFGCIETTIIGCEECNNILNFYECTKCYEGYTLNEKGECIINIE